MKLSDKYIRLNRLLENDFNVINNKLIDQENKSKYNTVVIKPFPLITKSVIDCGSYSEDIFNLFCYGKDDFEALLNAEKSKSMLEEDRITIYSAIEPVELSSGIPAYIFKIKI